MDLPHELWRRDGSWLLWGQGNFLSVPNMEERMSVSEVHWPGPQCCMVKLKSNIPPHPWAGKQQKHH